MRIRDKTTNEIGPDTLPKYKIGQDGDLDT